MKQRTELEQPGLYLVDPPRFMCHKCHERTATVCGKPCASCVLQADVWDFVDNLAAQSGNRLLKRQAKALVARREGIDN